MEIGDIIKTHNNKYKVIKDVAAGNRPNANVYLCEDEKGKKFIAKHFYNKRPAGINQAQVLPDCG